MTASAFPDRSLLNGAGGAIAKGRAIPYSDSADPLAGSRTANVQSASKNSNGNNATTLFMSFTDMITSSVDPLLKRNSKEVADDVAGISKLVA